MNPKEIEELLTASPEIAYAKVIGEGAHYELTVVSDAFVALSKVKRQLWVYAVLNELIVSGRMHAVQMHTWTKDEWEKQHG